MWGDGYHGVLGNGHASGSKIPMQCNQMKEKIIIHICCGSTHTGVIVKKSFEGQNINECKNCKVKLNTIFKKKVINNICLF